MHPLSPPGHQPLEKALLKAPASRVWLSGHPRQAPTDPQVCASPAAPERGWSSSSLSARPGTSQATTKPSSSLSPSTLTWGFGAHRGSACPASQSRGSRASGSQASSSDPFSFPSSKPVSAATWSKPQPLQHLTSGVSIFFPWERMQGRGRLPCQGRFLSPLRIHSRSPDLPLFDPALIYGISGSEQ